MTIRYIFFLFEGICFFFSLRYTAPFWGKCRYELTGYYPPLPFRFSVTFSVAQLGLPHLLHYIQRYYLQLQDSFKYFLHRTYRAPL